VKTTNWNFSWLTSFGSTQPVSFCEVQKHESRSKKL